MKEKQIENGITLIALIITVLLLIIIATVTIRSLIGHEGIINTTLSASEEHAIAQYREAIHQIAQEVILGNTNRGKDTTREDIAAKIREEEWVKEAEPDEESKTVRVITKEGYVFYVFYDEVFGKLDAEYIGKDVNPKAPYPKVKGRYEPKITLLFGSATVSSGKIAKLEIIYRSEVKATFDNPEGEVNLNVETIGLGWYKIRATTDKGKIGITWVYVDNVNDKLVPPVIKKDKEPNEAGWYNIETSPVTITLVGTGMIKYRIVSGLIQTEPDNGYLAEEGTDYTEPFQLNETGLSTIYAWTTDGTYRSQYAIDKIRIDKNKPEIDEPQISQANGKQGVVAGGKTWYTSNVQIAITGRDQTSEPIHYEYMLPGKNETWLSKQMEEKIPVSDEGDTQVAIRTRDTAGNPSDEKRITISIDRIAPQFTSNTVNATYTPGETKIKFSVSATDEGSGKVGGITYTAEVTEKSGTDKKTATSTNGSFEISGLKRDTAYLIIVKAKDPVGNESQISTPGEITIKNTAPTFAQTSSISKSWNSSTKSTNFTITARANDTESDRLTYTLYMKPSSSSTYTSMGSTSGNSGSAVTFNVTKYNGSYLASYTDYNWKVAVTDGKSTPTEESAKTIKTYCKTTHCTGPFSQTVTCGNCNGNGTVTTNKTCSSCGGSGSIWDSGTCYERGSHYNWEWGGGLANKTCISCGTKTTCYLSKCYCYYVNVSVTVGYFCSGCRGQADGYLGSNGHYYSSSKSCANCNGHGTVSSTGTCGTCNGHGTITQAITCTHSKSSSHYWCTHSNSYTVDHH